MTRVRKDMHACMQCDGSNRYDLKSCVKLSSLKKKRRSMDQVQEQHIILIDIPLHIKSSPSCRSCAHQNYATFNFFYQTTITAATAVAEQQQLREGQRKNKTKNARRRSSMINFCLSISRTAQTKFSEMINVVLSLVN